MRQRVMIAMALVNDPDLLIADEPTTALDVTTQAQILHLTKTLQQEFGSAIIMITHDLGVVAETADDVVVMYAAKVVEHAPSNEIFSRPRHPVHVGPARVVAEARRRRRAPRPDPGAAALVAQPAVGLPLPPAVPVRDECLPQRRASACARPGIDDHLQACHLDEDTKRREAEKLLEGTLAEAS